MSNTAAAQTLPRAITNLLKEERSDTFAGDAEDGLALSTLAPGQRAVVDSVNTASPVGRRLLDLGFIEGSEVRVVRRAPLRDPVEYEIRGTRICLRRSESELIRVRQATKP
jgi:ferrous iron transport protein A